MAIIEGITNLIGSGIQAGVQASENQKNRDFNAEQSQIAREFNALEAQKSRDWQQYMSNTSYQRAAADMEAAGINPAMAFANSANGASSSSGASASSSAGASATGQGTINVANLVNSAANLVQAFNYDKNRANDMNKKSMVRTIEDLHKLLQKRR